MTGVHSAGLHFYIAGGCQPKLMTSLNFGPIVFREEAVFRKEILLEDKVTISLQLLKSKKDYSRWTIRHPIVKNGDILATMLTVDGAWIDTVKRKLCLPPPEAIAAFEKMYKPEEFAWEGE